MTGQKNNRVALVLAGLVVGMVAVAYAAVPLYQLFCQVTGYGGTTQVAEAVQRPILERVIKVRFSASTHRNMPWDFRPVQRLQQARVGEQMLALFEAVNNTANTITGTATFNVTPHKAGAYFNKIECFCFTEQTLAPGARADMPVTYFIDPAIMEDPGLDDVKEIVLSYTFFRSEDDEPPGDSKDDTRIAENITD
jgi:cytochrome c oxidase assembly protein subunit 11